ncbi:AI-2E family transporter [Saccharicrinis sp. FJH54]|uniref:AI-2E family transporter n=1 Tax=Saccharicrinis sp. FJH54 TaxID=3344665 RepID=UPI0035D45406
MNVNSGQVSNTANILIVFLATLALMYLGRTILIPLFLGLILALILLPLSDFFEKKLPRLFSIILTYVTITAVLTGIMYFFGSQFVKLYDNVKDFGASINKLLTSFFHLVNDNLFSGEVQIKDLLSQENGSILPTTAIIQKTISVSSGFLSAIGLAIIFSFLFLLYRSSFRILLVEKTGFSDKKEIAGIIIRIKKVIQKYFYGVFFVMLILGILNGFGLWIIGIDYPFLFGFFAAFLAIIPYIGSFIGGALPFLYAVLNFDSFWPAVWVVLWYTLVQAFEGNFLTPKVVGSQVSMNPLFALIALILGGIIWGIAGMILFIPLFAILKIMMENIEELKPYSFMLGKKFGHKQN